MEHKTITATEILCSFVDANLHELIDALAHADDLYHNGEEPVVEDNVYDIAKRFAYAQNPAHHRCGQTKVIEPNL